MFKATHGMSPQCLQELFQIKDTPYSLRAPLILEQPKRRCTTYGLRSISYLGPRLWNDLPSHFKRCDNIDDFKACLKLWSGPSFEDNCV